MSRFAGWPVAVSFVVGLAFVAPEAYAQGSGRYSNPFAPVGETPWGTEVYRDDGGYFEYEFDDVTCDPDIESNRADPFCYFTNRLVRSGGEYVPLAWGYSARLYAGVNGTVGTGAANILFDDGSTGGFGTSGGMIGGTVGATWQIPLGMPPMPVATRGGARSNALPWKDEAAASRIIHAPRWSLVLGLEADLDFGKIRGTTHMNCALCEMSNTTLGTVRGTVGVTSGQWHGFTPFVTGGLAWGNVRTTVGGATDTDWRTGYAVGAGLNKALTHGWQLSFEGLYINLGDGPCGVTTCGAGARTQFSEEVFRVGLNHRF